MNQELIEKLHEEKYSEVMSFDDYSDKLDQGLQMIRTSGIDGNDLDNNAVNIALEYNIELMVNYLSM